MATCRDLIRAAMLEIRALASGEQPTADELSDGMARLQSIVDGLFGFPIGGPLADVVVEQDTTLEPDARALVFASTPITLTPCDMPTNGTRMQIKDMLGNFATYPVTIPSLPTDIVMNTNGQNDTYVYLEDIASWFGISNLTADSAIPLGDDEYFTLELAKRLAPMFGASLTAESAAALQRAWSRIRARFRSQHIIPCDDAVIYLSRQSYNTGFMGN
jgi:hypothetical protein